MKIVDYETFIRMPAGTIFAPWKPCVMVNEPEIKVDHGCELLIRFSEYIKNIWYFNGTCQIVPKPVEGEGFGFGEVESEFYYYDGDSNEAQDYDMFLIFEEKDIDNMIKVLEWAKNGCPGNDDPNCMLKGEKQ